MLLPLATPLQSRRLYLLQESPPSGANCTLSSSFQSRDVTMIIDHTEAISQLHKFRVPLVDVD